MGGAYVTIPVSDMLNGFENDVAAKVNGGVYLQGLDNSLTSWTQPIQRNFADESRKVEYGMLTGSNGVDEIGYLRIIDGSAYTNKKVPLFNGTDLVYYTQQDE